MSIKALLSKSDGSDESIDLREWGSRRISKDELLWIDFESPGPDELKILRNAVDVSLDTIKALEAHPGRSEARVLENAVEVVVPALADDDGNEPAALQILMGKEWVITRHETPVPSLDEHRERISDQREVGQLTPVEFIVSLLDRHVDWFSRLPDKPRR